MSDTLASGTPFLYLCIHASCACVHATFLSVLYSDCLSFMCATSLVAMKLPSVGWPKEGSMTRTHAPEEEVVR